MWEKNTAESSIFLIDGSSYIYRAFYAYRNLTRSDGFSTNVIYIVLRLLLKILKEKNPKYLGFFVDGKGPTFRQEIFAAYKANRLKMPEDLAKQIPILLEGLQLLGIYTQVLSGIEADDCIASLSSKFSQDYPVIIVGSDKDLNQLLTERVSLWDPGSKKEKFLEEKDFQKEWGFPPSLWPDFQALVGDSSDNIPGVPGIGPKTAKKLLIEYGSLENLEKNLSYLKGKLAGISKYFPQVYTYRKLTQLRTDCCKEITLADLQVRKPDWIKFKDFCVQYEFFSLLKEIEAQGKVELNNRGNLPLNYESNTKPKQKKNNFLKSKLPSSKVAIWQKEGFFLGDGKEDIPASDLAKWREFLEKSKEIYLYSFKDTYFQFPFLEEFKEKVFDLSLASYLLDPEQRDYSLDRLVNSLAQETSLDLNLSPFSQVILFLGEHLKAKVQAANLEELLQKLEQPLSLVLVKMEKRGILLDLEQFKLFLREVKVELQELTSKIYQLAGKEFNIRSSQQLAKILFEDLGLKSKKKTPTGQFSTSESALETLRNQHPIVELILKYRRLEKLRSTYLAPLPKKVDKEKRLHTTFNQLATATGRLSSSKPNLQNIPVRGEYGPRMRSCFVAPKGKYLLSADYSQIELRVLAHFSEDEYLLKAFQENLDVHTATACLIFEKTAEEITPDDRRKAKTINFGLLYGMGPLKLSKELKISMQEAKRFIELYFKKFTGVKRFYKQIESEALEKGFVSTILGRRRFLPNIYSRNEQMVAQAKRMAINTVVQGSAADIIKKAMLLIEEDALLRKLQAEQILQIHDELLLEVPEENIEEAVRRVKEIMEKVYLLRVPLVVDIGFGKNWGEAHS